MTDKDNTNSGEGDKLLFCSFCGKNQNEVRKLIAGPSVNICNECIDLCNDIIREEISESSDTELEEKFPVQKEIKSKTAKVIVKEIRFGPQTDEHDYQFKKKHAEKFLKDGAKLKAFVFFKGRSIIFKEQGQILLLRLAQELEEFGTVEQMPELEGKRMIMFITPKKK